MKQKDIFVGISFFTLAVGLGLLVAQTPPTDATSMAQMEPAAGEEQVMDDGTQPDIQETVEETTTTIEPAKQEAPSNEAMPQVYEAEASPADTENYQYTIEEALAERSVGSPNAPFVIYEYSSLSCPHCAEFRDRTFPHIKKELIDTGKVRWVHVPFPTNEPALMGVMLSRCVHPRRHARMLDLMYSNMRRWAFARDPNAALYDLVRIAGVDFDMYQKCLNDEMLEAGIVTQMREHSQKHNISGTPTFLINGKYKISGSQSFPSFMEGFETYQRYLENQKEEEQE